MKKRDRKSIVTETVIRVSIVFIIAIIMLAVISAVFMWRYMKQNIINSKEEQIDTISETLGARMNSLTEPIISLAKYDAALRLLGGYYEPYSPEWLENIRSLDTFLINVSMFNDYIVDINLIEVDSSVPYSMNDMVQKNYDFTAQEWFQDALRGEQIIKYAPPHGSEHLYSRSVKNTFSAVYPVHYAEELTGYILVECDLSRIADFFMGHGEDKSGYILLDADGDIIFDYRNDRSEEDFDHDWFAELKTDESVRFQDNGKLYIASRTAPADWIIVSENDYSIIIQPVQQMLVVVVTIMLIVTGALVLVTWLNGKAIEKPFNVLIRRIVSYDGSSSVDLNEMRNAPRELAVISSRFEEMADKVNALINEVYVTELRRKEMELEALTNQINPHFLYNVFQLIQTKAVLADNYEIEDMIQKLSGMMRYAMERKREKVFIREETEYLENYLMFYKARFPYMFSYELLCEEELMDCLTLKFILQPVVENCFKHAFKNKTAGGEIKIAIRREQEAVCFVIRDNGCGIDKEKLHSLCRKLEGSKGAGGIGIINTNARIQLVYGQPCGLKIDSKKDEFTEVKVCIRYER